ncbi:MarR family winged helix-turn-helix transcriptional regulator [Tautonia rosea]|uniref:MarR family winged helix-turn-helix transcriptional regulator n=1 Tax=Tautonia rosea TaxID=2728037 RepID=UPI0014745163|nr:MarR family winged helix-turn-helix transcriptional regulator [Tautonia rosea]
MTPEESRATAWRLGRQCLAIRMRLLNRVVGGIYDDALRPIGVRIAQFSLLTAIAGTEPIRPGDLATLLRMDKSTVSRDVDRLKASGWVVTEPAPKGRGQVLLLTEAGRGILAACLPAWEAAQAEAARLLGPEGVRSLHDAAPEFPPKC